MRIDSLAIRYDVKRLYILNQQKLPQQEEWIEVHSPEQMAELILGLKVRGAPLIGIAAALTLAQMAENGASQEEIIRGAKILKEARPTAVNLAYCIERVLAAKDLAAEAYEIFIEDQNLCNSMAEIGAALIQPGERVMTYCNTGSLATAGSGTALGVIKEAHEQGKGIHVYVCETRPLFQGARLTAWELGRCGIPYTLICDNMAASLMKKGKVDRVLVGADRIAANGDFANKIGTYSLAIAAMHHAVPFHVVAPYTTIDRKCPCGDDILIEERMADEVRGSWSLKEAPVYNPAFDVTPAELATSYILDTGLEIGTEFGKLSDKSSGRVGIGKVDLIGQTK